MAYNGSKWKLADDRPNGTYYCVPDPNAKDCTDICCVGESGNVLPIFGDDEQGWHPWLRGPLYGLGLCWIFLGVAIIADLFMNAIEAVTSAIKVSKGKDGVPRVSRVWNPVVANLSLMALGSSAPEILLNVIEIVTNDMFAGDLGPSTIVGSAAFNLFIIAGVCVLAITDGVKRIEGMRVYKLTATCSILAYIWLLLICNYISPDIIEIWEGAVTFMLFWALLLAAYIADKNFFRVVPEESVADPSIEQFAAAKKANPALTSMESKESMMEVLDLNKPNAATHTREALKMLTGKKARRKSTTTGAADLEFDLESVAVQHKEPDGKKEMDASSSPRIAKICFRVAAIEVLENCGFAKLYVLRAGCLQSTVSVGYESHDITATAGLDYVPVKGTLTFAPGETEKEISIEIKDDDKYEGKEKFRVELIEPSACELVPNCHTAQVSILNDDQVSGLFSRLINQDKCNVIMHDYKLQFVHAVYPHHEEDESPTALAWFFHVLTVVWKVLFATVPPTQLGGGWVAFYVALMHIAILTLIVGDLASLFGCIIGFHASITAITFVALGTSMPDTFASKQAAQSMDTADDCVGNVTGSNCVNVFLGIGLPWLLGAVFWAIQGFDDKWASKYCVDWKNLGLSHLDEKFAAQEAAFVVIGGDLGNSVVTFVGTATVCIIILALRRAAFGGELGGPAPARYLTMLVFTILWGIYLTVSCLTTVGKLDPM